MTDDEIRQIYFEWAKGRPKYGEQDSYGNSIEDLRQNLKLTVEERIDRHTIELRNVTNFLNELRTPQS